MSNRINSMGNNGRRLKKLRKIKYSQNGQNLNSNVNLNAKVINGNLMNGNILNRLNRAKTPQEIEEYTKKMEKVKEAIDGEQSFFLHGIMKLDRNCTIAFMQILSLVFLAFSFSLIFTINNIEFPTIPTPDFLSRLFVNAMLGLIGIFVGFVLTHLACLSAKMERIVGKRWLGRFVSNLFVFVILSFAMGMFTLFIYALNPTSCVMFYVALFMSLPASIGTYSILRKSKYMFALSVILLLSSAIFSRNYEDEILLIIFCCVCVMMYIESGEQSIRLGCYWESVREEVLNQLYRDGVLILDKRKKGEYKIKGDIKWNLNKKVGMERGKMHDIIRSAKEQRLEIKKIMNCVYNNMLVGVLISAFLVVIIEVLRIAMSGSLPVVFVDSLELRIVYGFALAAFVVLGILAGLKYIFDYRARNVHSTGSTCSICSKFSS